MTEEGYAPAYARTLRCLRRNPAADRRHRYAPMARYSAGRGTRAGMTADNTAATAMLAPSASKPV